MDLNAVSGSYGPFTIIADTPLTLPTTVNIVSVSVDADDFLTDPVLKEGSIHRDLRVLLTFIADISINLLSRGANLNFQLVRSTPEGTVPIGPMSSFGLTLGLDSPLTVVHAFEFLDKNLEPDDYTYSVQLLAGSNVAGAIGGTVSIVSATLSAIAAVI